MRAIEIYCIWGEDQKHICTMWFRSEKQFDDFLTRLLKGAPFNSLRRDRHEACCIRLLSGNGFISEYYTDQITNNIVNVCTEYQLMYGYARQLAKKRTWEYAWKFGSEGWKHRAILKQMGSACKRLRKRG